MASSTFWKREFRANRPLENENCTCCNNNCYRKITFFQCFWGAWPSCQPSFGQVICSGRAKIRTTYPLYSMHAYIYIYTHMYISCRVIVWAKFRGFRELLSGPSFFERCLCRGFSTFFERKYAQKFEGLLSGPSWPFLSCNKLGPDNNPYLAQIITLQHGHCFFLLLLKMRWNTYFIVFFEHQPKFGQKRGKKR